jgi:outer membrane receptor protein involved in Fe transport
LAASGSLLLLLSDPARAEVRQFDIPAGSLTSVLDAFARQSGRQLIYRNGDLRSLRSSGLRGRYDVEDALRTLLGRSGFAARANRSGAIAIVRAVPHRSNGATTVAEGEGSSDHRPAVQDIVVTGSRIPQPNLELASPVTTVPRQEIRASGLSRTENVLNALPQAYAAQGANISNGATGTATVNLRGLGEARSLVLVNGKRLQAGDMLSPFADMNFVPLAMVDRIEVLTGGASSVYGADAVAGVVNFILDTRQTGFRVDGLASAFNHRNHTTGDIREANIAAGNYFPGGWSTNGGAVDLTGVFGADFDGGRGHVTAYAAYRRQDAVRQSTRDFSFCDLFAVSPSSSKVLGRDFVCGGSLVSATGTFIQLHPVTGQPSGFFQVKGHEFVPGTTPFNTSPYNYFQRPDERYNAGAFAEYEIDTRFTPYLEAMFMDDHSMSQIAPSGSFDDAKVIACDNALLSPQQVEWICAPGKTVVGPLNGQSAVEQAIVYSMRRNVEGEGRRDVISHNAFRIVGGLRGEASAGIAYDAYYQRGRTRRNSHYINDVSITRLNRALDVIDDPRTPEFDPVCRAAVTGIDMDCVPWNIFQEGQVTPEALAYISGSGFQQGLIDETIAHVDATVSGDELGWRAPWADRGISVNFGAEYRKESLDLQVDEAFRSGDLVGQGGATPSVSGDFDVREVFAEAQLPIIENRVVDELVLSAGYRYSRYRVAGESFDTATYKLAAELAPVSDVRFRASYNRAVRAPNIVELFAPDSVGISQSTDPCANSLSSEPMWTLEQCERTGVTPELYGHILANPSGQYNALFGGNPHLEPEKADTLTAGVILQPRFIPGLALTADYFDIEVKNVISSPNFRATLEACAGVFGPSDPDACARIHRGPGGTLWLAPSGFVNLTPGNFSGVSLLARGIDVQGSYASRLGSLGILSISFVGTYLMALRAPGLFADCDGLFAGTCGTPNHRWRHKLRVTGTTPQGLSASVAWRHFSGVDAEPDVNPAASHLDAADYVDISFSGRLTGGLELRIGANNLFDRDPPLAGGIVGVGFGSGNTYPQVYDVLGRYIFAGVSVEF